jgi:hypothetical protein
MKPPTIRYYLTSAHEQCTTYTCWKPIIQLNGYDNTALLVSENPQLTFAGNEVNEKLQITRPQFFFFFFFFFLLDDDSERFTEAIPCKQCTQIRSRPTCDVCDTLLQQLQSTAECMAPLYTNYRV